MAFLDYWLDKSPVHWIGTPSFGAAVNIAVQHLVDRYQGTDVTYHDPARPDYLDRFVEVKQADPGIVDDSVNNSDLMMNLIAGSDTVAITLPSVFYYTLRNHAVWSRLQKELDSIVKDKNKPVSWPDTRSFPYLEAVMREAICMLPGVAMNLERYVPQDGIMVPPDTRNKNNGKDHDTKFVPAGTIVGLSPYVVSRNISVYGDDADAFRPERWLKGKEEPGAVYKARLAAMNAADLSFARARVSASAKTWRCWRRRIKWSLRWSSATMSSWWTRRRSGTSQTAGFPGRRAGWMPGSRCERRQAGDLHNQPAHRG